MSDIITVASDSVGEYEEKRSRFICLLSHIDTAEDAQAIIDRVKKQNYDARHNCWAYLLRDGSKRCSDDGEPQGTAGLPILEAIEKSGLTDVVAVVTRYFGGVLLGAGGLVRAYSKAAGEAIGSAQRCMMLPCVSVAVTCDYGFVSPLKRLLAKYGGEETNADYLQNVTLYVTLPADSLAAFSEELTEQSAGRFFASAQTKTYRPVLL